MEELIRQGLPGVDEGIIQSVIKQLQDLGMMFAEDCQYVEESYLIGVLKPIQLKKLLSHFKRFSAENMNQSQIFNIEFADKNSVLTSRTPLSQFVEQNNALTSKTLVPISMSDFISSSDEFSTKPGKIEAENSKIASNSSHTQNVDVASKSSLSPSVSHPMTSTSISDKFLTQIENNWPESFIIPWDSFPKVALEACEKKKRLEKRIYSEVVRVLAEHICRIDRSTGVKYVRIIASKIISKYPDTFQDQLKGSVIHGCSTLVKKITSCLENKRRRHLPDLFEGDATNTRLKKTIHNSYGCSSWQPHQLPAGETKSSQLKWKMWLKTEFEKLNRYERKVEAGMVSTYVSQRYAINTENAIKVVKKEWPFLFENMHFLNHAKVLLGKQSIFDTIWNNIDERGKVVYRFMTTQQKNTGVSKCLHYIETAKKELCSTEPEVWGIFLLLLAYFDEDEEELLQINIVPIPSTDLESNCQKLSPFIASSGGNIFLADEYFILIDGIVALKTDDFKVAMILLFLSFYVFNREYPVKAALTMEFFQRSFADINPPRGTKAPKVEGKALKVTAKPVLKLINSLQDYENKCKL